MELIETPAPKLTLTRQGVCRPSKSIETYWFNGIDLLEIKKLIKQTNEVSYPEGVHFNYVKFK